MSKDILNYRYSNVRILTCLILLGFYIADGKFNKKILNLKQLTVFLHHQEDIYESYYSDFNPFGLCLEDDSAHRTLPSQP